MEFGSIPEYEEYSAVDGKNAFEVKCCKFPTY